MCRSPGRGRVRTRGNGSLERRRVDEMTKADLVDVVYRVHGGLSRKESTAVVEQLIGAIKNVPLGGEKVQISGFGSFEVVRRRSRKGRNPQTGEVIAIDARQSLVFRPSKILVETLN